MNWIGRIVGTLQPVEVVWVTTKDDRPIRGVLVHRDRTVMILRAAQQGGLTEGVGTRQEQWTRMQGDIVIPWDNVAFYQAGLDPAILE